MSTSNVASPGQSAQSLANSSLERKEGAGHVGNMTEEKKIGFIAAERIALPQAGDRLSIAMENGCVAASREVVKSTFLLTEKEQGES